LYRRALRHSAAVDFAIEAQRNLGLAPSGRNPRSLSAALSADHDDATMAALLGGIPLMLGTGTGAEIRQPLGLCDRRRADRQPSADALHDADRLSLS
jgi:hypothetical protein